MLSLPFAFSKLGVILGIITLFTSAIASDYSVSLLIFSARKKGGSTSYNELGEKAFGNVGELLTSMVLSLLTFCCAIAYLELVSDLGSEVLRGIAPDYFQSLNIETIRRLIMLVMTLVTLPLSFKSSLHRLKWASVGCISSVIILAIIIVQKAVSALFRDVAVDSLRGAPNGAPRNTTLVLLTLPVQWYPKSLMDCLYAIPIFAIAFLCHFNCLPTHENK